MSVSDSCSGGYACGRCAQVEELLSLVVKLWEEVSRLRSIRESEREIDLWNHSLSSLRQAHMPATTQVFPPTQKTKVPQSRQAVRGDLGQGGEWKQVSAWGGRRALSLPISPSHLPLYNRYASLEHGSRNNDVDESLSQL